MFFDVDGAKHFPPGGKLKKSEGPHVAMVEAPFHQDSYGQAVSKWRILDIHHADVQRRFQLCPPQVLNPNAYVGSSLRCC